MRNRLQKTWQQRRTAQRLATDHPVVALQTGSMGFADFKFNSAWRNTGKGCSRFKH